MDGAYISAFNILQEMQRSDIEIYHYHDTSTYSVQPHRHDFYELYCILSGGFAYHVEENTYMVRPGSLLLVRPGERHWPEFSGPPEPIERIVVWLNPDFIGSLSEILPQTLGTLDRNLRNGRLILPEKQTYQVMLGLLYSLLYEKNRADADSQYLCHLILSQLLIHISRALNVQAAPPERIKPRYGEIMKVHDYINSHFREMISVSSLAERFFMDKNTLTRQFKRMVGMTPGDYIRRKRLESAHAMILQGYSAQSAGYASGFSDYSAFYRAFRRIYGVAPSRIPALSGRSAAGTNRTQEEE